MAGIALACWRLQRLGKAPRWFWVLLAIGGSFWILAGLNQMPGRDPVASRYQYVGAIFVMLVAAELLRGIRVGRSALVAIGVVAAAAIAGNIYYLHQAYDSYHHTSQLEKAALGAVDIARDTVEPGFVLSEDIADTAYVHVETGAYLSARDAFGTPAYDPQELAESSAAARFAADKVLFGALHFELTPAPGSALPSGVASTPAVAANGRATIPADACVSVPGGPEPLLLSLPRGGVVLRAGAAPIDDIRLIRFASGEFPIDLQAGLAPGKTGEIRIPSDRSSVPWKMEMETNATATVCGLDAASGQA